MSDEIESMSDEKKMNWYVVHAYSGYENRVSQLLKVQIEANGWEELFGRIVIPTEEVVEMRSGKKRKSERKFFPGYVLVEMVMDDRTWHMVRNIPRVLGFIGGTSEKPVPISEKEAKAIMNRMEADESKPRHKVLFEPGEVVRVIDGPFADFDGVVEDVNYDKSRLVVSVSIFGRSTPVELEFSQVEKN